MKKFYLSVFLLLLAFTVSISAAEKEILIVTGEFAPFVSEKDKDGRMAQEIIDAIGAEIGVKYVYRYYPWKRGYYIVKSGEMWATMPYYYTGERAKDMFYPTEPLYVSSTKFFYYAENEKDKPNEYNELGELKKYAIGGALGWFYNKVLKDAGLDVEYASSEELNLKKLVAGRIQLFPHDEIAGRYLINQLFPKKSKYFGTLQKPLNKDNLYLIASKTFPNSKEILAAFDKGLKLIKEKGIHQAILKKYGVH